MLNSQMPATALDPVIRIKLSVMMFLQYFIWGAWFVTLATYLGEGLGIAPDKIGLAYGTAGIAAIFSPILVGMVADRFFPTQGILAILHLAGGLVLFAISRLHDFAILYPAMLVYFACYMPTLALTNSLSMRQMSDPSRQFPGVRVLGTIGWIAAGLSISFVLGRDQFVGADVERTNAPILMAAGSSLLLGLFCFVLPHTPPSAAGQKSSLLSLLGFDALKLMKEWSFTVFVIGSFLICIPLQFYYASANLFLNTIGVENAAGKMTAGQMSEIVFMLIMPLFFARLGVKKMLLVGMLCWVLRYTLFAFGNAGSGMWMIWVGILLHGVCYDFFFVTGQIYVDNKAPRDLRASAQGFIALVTLGFGAVIGSYLQGVTVAANTSADFPSGFDWRTIWLIPAAAAGIVMVLFALLFNDRAADDADVDLADVAEAAAAEELA
ncbi:MAG: nucleoside permease [Planctomycetales bacterium]|nr:nucleoside permease [Planctomycetales bacterium]